MNTPPAAAQALVDQLDLGIAHEAYSEIWNWIETLQQTDHWHDIPVEVRRAICSVHALSGMAADRIEPLI